jgi:hypothetical protein
MEDTAGIPTGLAPDITRQIALRRGRTRAVSSGPTASVAAYSPAPAPSFTAPVEAAPAFTQPGFSTAPGFSEPSGQSAFDAPVTGISDALPADPPLGILSPTENAEEPQEPPVRRAPDNLA